MSPQRSKSTGPPPRSKNRTLEFNSTGDGGQFTKSKQSSAGKSPSDSGPDRLDPEATEPFPPDLFRVPVPNRVFGEMAGMSDAALRCLLGLIHLSWRFDPEESAWVHTEEWLTRADVQDECGLSDQGTRDGLSDLEERGLAEVDRSGRSYQYKLQMEVPIRRFTYLPTSLFEKTSATGSATALRVLLAVFRATWGWTESEPDPETGGSQTVHQRWARLSKADLAEVTGHSDTAITRAVKTLEGTWLGRSRPDGRAHFYRVLPGAFGPRRGEGRGKEEDSPNATTANAVAPHRQRSCPPSYYKESFSKDKHSQPQKKAQTAQESSSPSGEEDAMPSGNQTQPERPTQNRSPEKTSEQPPKADFTGLPDEKRDLAEKLANVGVWAGRIAEILSRFSRRRIEANFELYRQRAAQQTIHNPGAWLHEAITEGYALPDSVQHGAERRSSHRSSGDTSAKCGSLPPLEHKETLSEARKDAYVAQGTDEERFHRCPPSRERPDEPRYMYFDPDVGEPSRRGASRRPEA